MISFILICCLAGEVYHGELCDIKPNTSLVIKDKTGRPSSRNIRIGYVEYPNINSEKLCREKLSNYLGSSVLVRFIGKDVCLIYKDDDFQTSINETLVTIGYAASKEERGFNRFKKQEQTAKANKLGIWGN